MDKCQSSKQIIACGTQGRDQVVFRKAEQICLVKWSGTFTSLGKKQQETNPPNDLLAFYNNEALKKPSSAQRKNSHSRQQAGQKSVGVDYL